MNPWEVPLWHRQPAGARGRHNERFLGLIISNEDPGHQEAERKASHSDTDQAALNYFIDLSAEEAMTAWRSTFISSRAQGSWMGYIQHENEENSIICAIDALANWSGSAVWELTVKRRGRWVFEQRTAVQMIEQVTKLPAPGQDRLWNSEPNDEQALPGPTKTEKLYGLDHSKYSMTADGG